MNAERLTLLSVEDAAEHMTKILASLPEDARILLHRSETELEPDGGWRRFKAGDTIVLIVCE